MLPLTDQSPRGWSRLLCVSAMCLAWSSQAQQATQVLDVVPIGEHIQDIAVTPGFVVVLSRTEPKREMYLTVLGRAWFGPARRLMLWPYADYSARLVADGETVWVYDRLRMCVACVDLESLRVVQQWHGYQPISLTASESLVVVGEASRLVGVDRSSGEARWATPALPAGRQLLANRSSSTLAQRQLLVPLWDPVGRVHSIASVDIDTGIWSGERTLGPGSVRHLATCGELVAVVQPGLVTWFRPPGNEAVAEVEYEVPPSSGRAAPTWSSRNATAWDGRRLYFTHREPPMLLAIDGQVMDVAWTKELPGTPSTTFFAMTSTSIVVGCASDPRLEAKPTLDLLWVSRESGKFLASHRVALSDDLDWGGRLLVPDGEDVIAVERGTTLLRLAGP